jgi:hypothetical protein
VLEGEPQGLGRQERQRLPIWVGEVHALGEDPSLLDLPDDAALARLGIELLKIIRWQ